MVLKNFDFPDESPKEKRQCDDAIEEVERLIAHPVCGKILKALNQNDHTARELMKVVYGFPGLEEGEEMSDDYRMKHFKLLHHLKKLEKAELVDGSEKRGKARVYKKKKRKREDAIEEVERLIAHPVRIQILKALKQNDDDHTTKELMKVVYPKVPGPGDGEEMSDDYRKKRFKLLHHLKKLEKAELVDGSKKRGKERVYKLKLRTDLNIAVLYIEQETIEEREAEFARLLHILADIEGEEIPFPGIKQAKMVFYY